MHKIWILLFCIFCTLYQTSMPAKAAEQISFDTPICLTVNGTYLAMDAEPFLHEGVTFVPIRFVSEALGADVLWDSENSCALIYLDNTMIELPIGKKYALVNGKKTALSQGVKLVYDRTYVPVRFAAETLGFDVDWESSTYTVVISKNGISVPEHLEGERGYDDSEIYWLSKIIHAESRGEPMKGKIAVGNVVLNRVESNEFPNTVYGVIFDKKYGVQFSPILDGSIHQTPLGDSVVAAKRALSGETEAEDCLYFLNPRTATSSWIINNRTYLKTIANHDFYL